MITPTTHSTVLLLLLIWMLAWGLWANLQKSAGRWRFELFYLDYSIGVLVAALIAAFTFGSFGNELSFVDNMLVATKRSIAYGMGAGAVFNLGNFLFVAALALSGLSIAFPIALGLGLTVGYLSSYLLDPETNRVLLGGGLVLLVAAFVIDAMAYSTLLNTRQVDTTIDPVTGKARKGPRYAGVAKTVSLASIGGLLMGASYPVMNLAVGYGADSGGLGPYALATLFAVGMMITTVVYDFYFFNLPIQGKTISLGHYLKSSARQHGSGLAAGIVWSIGLVAAFLATGAPKQIQSAPARSYAFGEGAVLVSIVCGALIWKEWNGGIPRVRVLFLAMAVLFVAAIATLSYALPISR